MTCAWWRVQQQTGATAQTRQVGANQCFDITTREAMLSAAPASSQLTHGQRRPCTLLGSLIGCICARGRQPLGKRECP